MTGQDSYRSIAAIYDRVIEPMQAGVRRVALEVVPPQPGWEVLDVGCGTGTGLVPYADAGCKIVGVDVSPSMLSKAAGRLGDRAQLHLGDGETLPLDADRFDLVTTSMVLHEVPANARGSFLAEMARVTKPDGRMLVVDFRFGPMRGWKGPLLRAVSWAIERLSGHYSGFKSFKADGGVPHVVNSVGLDIRHEKIVAGGNLSIYVVGPDAGF